MSSRNMLSLPVPQSECWVVASWGACLQLLQGSADIGVQIFGDPQDSPAGQVSDRSWPSPFTDHDALRQFAQHVDVVTYEQENIPVATVETLLEHVPVFPGPELLRASQHRLLEKTSLRRIGIPTADFLKISSAVELRTGNRGLWW